MSDSLTELKKLYERQIGKQEQVNADCLSLKREIRSNRKKIITYEKAHEIVKIVGGETQKQLQYHISDITSLALESVFPEPYKLVLDFIERRGKVECDILFERNGNIIKPKDASGFGAMDIASLSLRVAAWSMKVPRTRSTIIMDEPFKNLSKGFHEPAALMIKELSEKLGIQFIITTHITELADISDRAFKVKIKNGTSKVTQIN